MSTERAHSYAGDVSPLEAWKLLSDNPNAVLVDVRTDAEWRFVGVPDLSSLGREVVFLEWNTSDGRHNPDFADQLRRQVERRRPARSVRCCSCAARVTAPSAPPRWRPSWASRRPTTCSTASRVISTPTATAVKQVGGQSVCPGSRDSPDESGRRRFGPHAPALPDGVSQATIGVRGGLLRSGFDETAEALYLTSGYVYESAAVAEQSFTGELDHFVYSRYGNPTVTMFEERLRLLEGAPAAFATASGMAAVFTSLGALLAAGDRLVAARSLFGSCFVVCNEILPRWGVQTVFVDGDDLAQWEEALSVPTAAVFFETPSNPMQSLVDIAAVTELAHAAGAKVVLDNVFATPLLQQGIPLGVDVVVYSGTKHIDGQGRVLGGAILGDRDYIDGPVQKLMRHTGPAMSAFNAWVLLKALRPWPSGWNTAIPRRTGSPNSWRPIPRCAGSATRICRPTRSTTWPSARCPAAER